LEQNIMDIRLIQVLLGHAKLETTGPYTRVAINTIRTVMSPLDRLPPERAAPSFSGRHPRTLNKKRHLAGASA
jgi:hypothetical protein